MVETSIGAIPDSHRETVYAIARELITNAAKHAHASRLTVAARVDEGASVLQLRDDGRGFERDALDRSRRGHIGLVAVRERIARLGGGLEILSAPGQGALITVWIPIDHHEYAERLEHPTPVWRAPLRETPPSADAA